MAVEVVQAYLGKMYKPGDEEIEPIRIAAEEYATKDKKGSGFFGIFGKKEHPFQVVSIPVMRNGRKLFYRSTSNPLAPKIPLGETEQARISEILGAYAVGFKGGRRTRRVKRSRAKAKSRARKN